MTKDEKIVEGLMKPRYKVIADYPGLKIKVGKILIPNKFDPPYNNQWVTPDPNDRQCLYW